MKNRLVIAGVFGVLFMGSVNAQTLVAVPIPEMGEWEAEVRVPIEKAVRYFERKKVELDGPKLGKAYGRLGMVFQARQINDATKAAYENAIALDPTDPHWHYYMGVYYEEVGDFQSAVKSYRASQALQPNYANTYLRLGEVYLEAGELEKARESFKAMLAIESGSAASLAGMGTVAERLGSFDEAVDYLTRALVFQPEATQLHYRLAQIYRRLGNVDQAKQHLEKTGDRKASSVDPWIEVMKARRNDSNYYVKLGEQAMIQGNANRAQQAFSLALAIDPEDVTSMVNLATVYGVGGRKEAGARLIDRALELEPDHSTALSLKASLLEAKGQRELSQDLFRRAIKGASNNPELHISYGSSLLMTHDYDAAVKAFDMAAQLQPKNPNAFYLKGVASLGAKKCQHAAKAFEHAVELVSTDGLSLNALSRTWSSCPGTDADDLAAALKIAEDLYGLVPNGNHSETLAMVMARLGRFEEAQDYQTQAIFESLKQGRKTADPFLKENMLNYQSGKPSERAFHPEDGIFGGRKRE